MINVLVLGATGKQGSHVSDALLIEKTFVVHGLTRNCKSAGAEKLRERGGYPVEGDLSSRESIEAALKGTNSSYMFIVTPLGTKESEKDYEIAAGKAAIDAAIACSLEFVVFSSTADADVCYDNITHWKSKFEIENYLKSTGLRFAILRPVSFLDNFDDSQSYNPLTRGCVKGLVSPNIKLKMVACRDVGKAAAKIFMNPEKFHEKTITCVSCDASGEEVAAALSSASNEPCKYYMQMPKWLMRLVIPDIARMVTYLEEKGYSCTSDDISEFLDIVPDALDAEGFFKMKGRWANGEVFGTVPVPCQQVCEIV